MRHLRKDSPSPGHLRTRVLAVCCLAFAAAGLALALSSCAPGKPAGQKGVAWYELASTVFQSVGAADAAPQVPAMPWTVQNHVTDMAFLGDTLYLAVNGAGVAGVEGGADGRLSFTYHYDAPIFSHRTITALIPRYGDLLVHLYYNALLNDAKPEDLVLRGISLVTFLPGQKAFAFLIPPYQKKNPSWEAVGFAPLSENEFDFEWKYTDSAETDFVYTRYRADLQLEAGSTRDAYMAALGSASLSGAGVPPAYSAFFQECQSRIKDLSAGTALHFKVRSRANAVQKYYRSGSEQDAILLIHVLDENGVLSALLPNGQVLEQSAGAPARTFALPALPEGFHYTDFVKMGDLLIAAWEESPQFTQVGRAGIVSVRTSPQQP